MSDKKYKKCCRPYHTSNQKVPNPTALIRARFSAYALGHTEFIMYTTHPEAPSFDANTHRWEASLEAYCLRTAFVDLEILSAEDDKASYRMIVEELFSGRHAITEHCTFKEVNGRWLYYDGELIDEGEAG